MRRLYIRWSIWFILLFGLGLANYLVTGQWRTMIIEMAVFAAAVTYTILGARYNARVVLESTDMRRVERLLRRYRRRPFQGYILAMLRHDYTAAREFALKHRNPSQRARLVATVALAEGNLYKLDELLGQITNEEFRHYLGALKAIKLRDWDQFAEETSAVSDESTLLTLRTEEAFAHGDMTTAEALGQQRIERAKGLSRYILVKGREENERRADREWYF